MFYRKSARVRSGDTAGTEGGGRGKRWGRVTRGDSLLWRISQKEGYQKGGRGGKERKEGRKMNRGHHMGNGLSTLEKMGGKGETNNIGDKQREVPNSPLGSKKRKKEEKVEHLGVGIKETKRLDKKLVPREPQLALRNHKPFWRHQ